MSGPYDHDEDDQNQGDSLGDFEQSLDDQINGSDDDGDDSDDSDDSSSDDE